MYCESKCIIVNAYTPTSGSGLLVSPNSPGIFLQGLAVYDLNGKLLPSPSLPSEAVQAAFDYATRKGVGAIAYLGDNCVTLQMTPWLQELN